MRDSETSAGFSRYSDQRESKTAEEPDEQYFNRTAKLKKQIAELLEKIDGSTETQ